MSSRRFPWTLSVITALAAFFCLAAWFLPASKQGGVFGRLNYPEFMLAPLLTGALVSLAVLLFCAPSSRHGVGLRLGLLWLGTLVALLGSEALALWLPVRQALNNPWYMTGEAAMEASQKLPFVRPPHVEWTGVSRGDIAMMMGAHDPYAQKVTFHTDHEGFRNAADLKQADLIFIGDSATEAGNIPEQETFVQLAGNALDCSVRNMGRTGYTTLEELIVLEDYGLPCKPKTVVWQISESTDLAEAVHTLEWISKGRQPMVNESKQLEPIDVWRHRSLSYRLFNYLRSTPPWSVSGTFVDTKGIRHPVAFLTVPGPQHSPRNNAGWQPFADALVAGKAILDEQNIDLIVLLLPIKLRAIGYATELSPSTLVEIGRDWDLAEQDTLSMQLAALCEELNVPYIDATPALREAASAGQLVFLPLDVHMSPQGHRVVANLLNPVLEKSHVGSGP